MKTVVDEAGRIQLSEEGRSQLGVVPGDQVILEPRDGEWVLKSVHATPALTWEGNVLVHQGTSLPGAAAENLIDQARDERFGQLTEGFVPLLPVGGCRLSSAAPNQAFPSRLLGGGTPEKDLS